MKSLKLFILVVLLLIISGCAGRVPFKAQKPLENAALVYMYISSSLSTDEGGTDIYYRFLINGKIAKEKIRSNEYIALDLKPALTSITLVRGAVEERSVTLNLEAGKIYYLKANVNLENDDFELIQVSEKIGSKEILKTGLAESTAIDKDNLITEYVNKPDEKVTDKSVKVKSEADEIQRLYDMKEKGVLTQEEFETLKAKVIGK
jgi:hypothetical protein